MSPLRREAIHDSWKLLAILFAVSLTESADLGVRHVSSSSSESARWERERLIRAHLPLVRSVARRYLGRGESLEDLVQVGSIGLIKSSKRFDPDRGVAFATYATPAIEGEIRRHLAGRASSVQISGDSDPMSDDDAAELSETVLPTSSDDRLLLADSFRSLDEREQRIVFLRFHADMTERQIAQTLKISQAHVSRLLGGALAKLRQELETTGGGADIRVGEAISVVSTDASAARSVGDDPTAPSPTSDKTRIADVTASQPKRTGYSGRFLVRMPSTLHEQLARAAERDDTSLNRFVTAVLARAVAATATASDADATGAQYPQETLTEQPPSPTPPPTPDGPIAPVTEPAQRSRRDSAHALKVALAATLVVVVVAGVAAIALLVLALQRGV